MLRQKKPTKYANEFFVVAVQCSFFVPLKKKIPFLAHML